MPTNEQVKALANFYKDRKNEIIIAWLSNKLFYEVGDEDLALEAMQVAEEKISIKKVKNNASRLFRNISSWCFK